MKRKLSTYSILMLASLNAFAAGAPSFTSALSNFLNTTVKPAFPFIVGIVFVITCVYNLGDLQGDNKNWKHFFSMMLIFVGGVLAVGVLFNFLLLQNL